MRYMLDTDTFSYIMKRSNAALMRRAESAPASDLCISAITKAELLYGAVISPKRDRDEETLNRFLPYIEVLDFPGDAASHYADIRAHLKTRGSLIGANDLFIAAHARSLGLTLVTNNTKEFGRVPNLTVENWTKK